MLKKGARIFGCLMVFLGLLGFIPGVTHKYLCLGIFKVNSFLNLFHLITGLLAYWVGRLNATVTRVFLQAGGIIYGIIGVLGFAYSHKPVLKVMANNMADAWLHIGIAFFCLFMGFFYKNRS